MVRREPLPIPSLSQSVMFLLYTDSDPETSNRFRIKVGRSIHMNKRLDQWGKQCWSKEVVLRGWWPEEDDSNERILLKGLRKEGKKAKYCHRLERKSILRLVSRLLPLLNPIVF